jgi:phosphate transport system substrate-binding protein
MKMMAVALAALCVVQVGVVAAGAEEIRIGGGGTPIDGVFRPVKTPFEKATGNTIKLNFSSATLAFKQLAAGELDGSTAGLAYQDLLIAMKSEKLEVGDPAAYQATTLGSSKIFTVVNKDNPVSKLSKEQLQGIFTGKIANWKEVGGQDAPIIVVLSKINPATNAAFRKLALADQPYAADVLDAGRFEDLREKVASTPESIGFGPTSMLDKSIKTVETPEISRPVNLITKGKPSAKVQKLIDYIMGEGHQYLNL